MARKKRKITDISFDVLRHVMLHISKSSGGAKNLIMVLAACRVFKELAEDAVILKAVTFDDVKLSETHESFFQINGLLFRCIQAGNLSAMGTALEYWGTTFDTFERDLNRAEMNFRRARRKVQIVNTRERRRAMILAYDDLLSVCDYWGVCKNKAQIFLEAMNGVVRSLSRGRV